MKLKIYSMIAASLLVLGSCAEQDEIGTPIQTGDEISFGISTPGEVKTRTIYGAPEYDDEGNGYFPVYWEQDDEIAIYCPQAVQPATQLVHYKITPDKNDASTSSAVTRVGDVGLQWGDRNTEHRFYGFYPASAVKGTETDGRIISEIPVFQSVKGWTDNGKEVGTGKVYTGAPDTKFAYMFAYTAVKPDTLTAENPDIPLKFSPLVTILEVEVNGPTSGSSIKVTNVNVTSSDGTALAGNFECLISDRSGTCKPVDDGTVTNRVSVSCYDNDKDDFIELGVGDKMIVKLFLLPETGTDIAKGSLKVTVSTLNGAAKTKTLQTADVLSQRVNRVSLPALVANDDTNYWMSNLDKDIFFTELSIPGSHQSVGLENEDYILYKYEKYQTQEIAQQFKDGIRAFSFQTTYNGTDGQIRVYASGNEKEELHVYLKQIQTELETAYNNGKSDFAVVSIVFKDNGSYGNPTNWFNSLAHALNSNSNYTNLPIYKDGITANTTIEEVANKIVLRIDRPGTIDVPALMSAEQPSTAAPKEIQMYWGNQSSPQVLTMYAHDGTSIDNGNNEWGEIDNIDKKKEYIQNIFNTSVDLYKNNDAHNYFYHTNVGGFYCIDSRVLKAAGGHTISYTQDIMPSVIDFIQNRGENASLGVVLMNFADKQGGSGADYGCDALIQTIIDNNFKFALRKKTSATTSAASYNASYQSGGNAVGWDK